MMFLIIPQFDSAFTMNFFRILGIISTLSLLVSHVGLAQEWPQFRGEQGTASTTTKLPTQWTPNNYKWKTTLPGRGWSSPVYADGVAWMTSAIDEKADPEAIKKKLEGVEFAQIKTASASVTFYALCVDLATGELIHKIELGKSTDTQPINPMNSYASPTPVIADGKVVCHFGNYGTWCLDAKTGEEIWKTEYDINHSVGPGSSPIVVGDSVILVCDGYDQQFLAGVDLQTGKQAWKTNRPPINAENGEFKKSYCTPIVREVNGQQQVIVTGANWICGYNPVSGEEIWRLNYGDGYSITGMPALIDGTLVFVTGYNYNEFVGCDPSGKGELKVEESLKWRQRGAPAMSSFVVHNGMIYSAGDRGVFTVHDPQDGTLMKRFRTIGNMSSSPLLAAEHLYLGNRDGQFVVIKIGEELEVVHEYDFGSGIYASPCPIDNDLLVRTANELIRISNE